jgi:hypothetical protein
VKVFYNCIVTCILLLFTLTQAHAQEIPENQPVWYELAQSVNPEVPLQKPDSLMEQYGSSTLPEQIDSLYSTFMQETDSLKSAFQSKLLELSNTRSHLQQLSDSLHSINLPTDKVKQKIDSLVSIQKKLLAELDAKIQNLKEKTVGRLEVLELTEGMQSKVSEVLGSVENYKLPIGDLDLPSLDIAGFDLPSGPTNLEGITDLNFSFENLTQSDALQGYQDKLGGIGELSDKAGEYSRELQQYTLSVDNLSETMENKAVEYTGLNEALQQPDGLGQYQEMFGQMQNPDALKDEAVQQVQEYAFDHFAGKQEVLQQAMEQMEKIKDKYESFSTLPADFKKGYNEMKGKSLKERLIPGIAIQLMKDEYFMTDINAYLGFRITGQITAGTGWNHRVIYDFENWQFRNENAVYGPRFFGEYKLKKGFYPRLEIETMHTNQEPQTTDIKTNDWVWGSFVGIKKEFGLVSWMRGTVMMMFNVYEVFSSDHRSPYNSVVNGRLGFEFPMKKKVKPKETNK